MHIFLTGNIQVGKSTIIKRLLKETKLSADGFLTYWEPCADGGRSLFLSPYSNTPQKNNRRRLADDGEKGFKKVENISDVFNSYGTEILYSAGCRDVIVMDELGFLETTATVFQEAVLRRVRGGIPILGVIKPAQTEFLDAIRAQTSAEIHEITADNREHTYISLLSKLRRR